MIRILYFASLRERLGSADETLQEHPRTLADLRAQLAARGGVWGEVTTKINGDEVALFPPVTGG